MLTFIPKNMPADGPIDANASQLLDSISRQSFMRCQTVTVKEKASARDLV